LSVRRDSSCAAPAASYRIFYDRAQIEGKESGQSAKRMFLLLNACVGASIKISKCQPARIKRVFWNGAWLTPSQLSFAPNQKNSHSTIMADAAATEKKGRPISHSTPRAS